MQNTQEKADLQKTKVNVTKTRKLHATEINFSSLRCRLIVVVMQAQADKNACSL